MTTLAPLRANTPVVAPSATATAFPDNSPQPAAVTAATDAPVRDHSTDLKTALGDHCNRRTLDKQLRNVIQNLAAQILPDTSLSSARKQMEAALASQLKSTTMYVCEDGTYSPAQPLPANRLISLEAYLLGCGIKVPHTLEALVELKNQIATQLQVHPLGNLSGGLSWPQAMPLEDQRSITRLLQSNTSGLPGLPLADPAKGALAYLLSGSPVSDADLEKPRLALEKLLGSNKSQALGRAIQSHLDGAPTDTSGVDYVMTAVHLGLDPESQGQPARNTVAGFDLARSQHWGQKASVVLEGLSQHLIEKGRATSKSGPLGAYLLLARTAPEFLVKDIPPSVTYGSVLWTQLAIAVSKVEAQTPGRTLGMGYAEILLAADALTDDEALSEHIAYQALWDWGVASGVLAGAQETPSAQDMERVRVAYNSHLNALKNASELLQTEIPSRKNMALDLLKETFPDLDPKLFEAKHLYKARLKTGRPGAYPGMRSMLDIVMEGGKLGREDHWLSNDKRLPTQRFCDLFEVGKLDVSAPFKTAYDAAIKAHEEGHQIMTRHLISTLPLESRQDMEHGLLTFFHTNQYKIAGDLFTPPALHVRANTLEVKATSNKRDSLRTINTQLGSVEKEDFLLRRRTEPYTASKMEERDANTLSKTQRVVPAEDAQFAETPVGEGSPDSFNSARSHAIADVFVKSLDLKNTDLLNEARGVTSYDQETARDEAIAQFFLNLIPFRSAIVNFQNGNVGQGVFDLAVDVTGFLTLGAGKAAQAGKLLGGALSTAGRAAKAARFVGARLVEAINPLSGLGDLVVGGGKLAIRGGRYAASKIGRQLNQLKGATGGYDLLKAASKLHGDAATGLFKVAGQSVEGGAVLHKGKWYALDPQTLRAYGRPLEDFVPGARAVGGKLAPLPTVPDGDLSNGLFREFNVPESRIKGLSRNNQGVYVAADGHVSHIRHTDSAGQSAVYEVRQVSRTADGKVQARVYHNNRQTSLVVEHVQGDQWQRLGLMGGNPPSIKADLGPVIGKGGEGIVYASLDGKRAYKLSWQSTSNCPPDFEIGDVKYLNQYYGEGFARTVVEDGLAYLVMRRLEGVDLPAIAKGSLPPEARSLLADTIAQMEAKGIYHNDLQMKNFMYSAKDNVIYPVDMDAMPGWFVAENKWVLGTYETFKKEVLEEYAKLFD